MNKFFTRIVGAALGLAMAIGVGVAVSSTSRSSNEIDAAAFSGTFDLYSGAISEGDYVITYGNYALKNAISSNRFANGNSGTEYTISESSITNPDSSVVWHIAASGNYWTIYNAAVSKYAGGNSTKNNGALLSSVTDYAKWTASGTSTYNFENLGRANGSKDTGNKWLRNNGSYGWATYADSTGGALTLYKKATAKTVSSVNIQTQPTKTEYKLGEAFDPSGLVVRVTYTDNTYSDVTYSLSNSSKFEFTGFNSSSAVENQQVTVKYTPVSEQFTCTTKVVVNIIEVNPNAILVDTSSVKKTYRVGQTLDLTDLVITVGFDDDSDEEYTIESNANFVSKGFILKLGDSAFDLSTTLSMSHNGASFVVYFGELNDSSDTVDIIVENVATITLSDASTQTFWSSSSTNSYDNDRAGVVGNGTQFQAFEGKWYINGGFQMNEPGKNSYISNITALGTIKSVVVSANNSNATYFSMYYGTSANPSVNKITASVSSNTWTYDFTNKNATFFKLAKDVTKGSVVMSSIAITYSVNDLLDRTQAGAFSQYFLDITSGLCDSKGINNGVSEVWTKLSGVYALLSDPTKASLKAKAQASGGVSDGTTVGNAMARYYWAVNNHGANTDFIGDVSNGAKLVNGLNGKDNSTVIIVTVIMASCLVIVSGCFFIRRRKQR